MMDVVLGLIVAGMEGARIESIVFRASDRTAVVGAASDHDAHALATNVGIKLRVTTSGSKSWLTGVGTINGFGVVITSPTRTAHLGAVP